MTKAGTQAYTFDVNGNLTNDGRYKYTWNEFDQLTTVKSTSGDTIATYQYDENGRRIYSKVGTTETYYRYDGTSNHVLFETNKNGTTITKAYTYDAAGHPLTMTYNGETYYYLTNYRGDVLTLTNASGNAVAEYTYDAWGNILTQTGAMASINPYRYAGYRYDEETKLYYLMARYYNPDTGVFLSLDPVRGDVMNPITMNGYNYANNNPVMNVDPDGEFPLPLLVAILRFAIPLIKNVGQKSLKIIVKHIKIVGKKYLNNYIISTPGGGTFLKINVKKKNGKPGNRIFAIDYHTLNNYVFRKSKPSKNYGQPIWHVHNHTKMHYIIRELFPSDATFKKGPKIQYLNWR